MTEITRKAIVALLAVDETASEEERNRVTLALAGEAPTSTPKVLRIAEVAERLGRTKQTVHNLINAGRLKTVPGAGIFSAGVTEESFRAYVMNQQH